MSAETDGTRRSLGVWTVRHGESDVVLSSVHKVMGRL